MVMKNYLLLLLFTLFFIPVLSYANNYSEVHYTIKLLPNVVIPTIKVEMEIKGEITDKIIVDLPSHWADGEYAKQIKNIQLLYPVSEASLQKKDDQIIISAVPKTDSVRISYEISQKQGNPSDVHEAIIRNDLIHSPGYGLFATPDLENTEQIQWGITWENFPENWSTISSYGEAKALKFIATAPKFLHAIYVAGQVRMHQIANKHSPVYLSLYGEFDMKDEDIILSISEIIQSQRLFFNDFDFPYYAISLIEGDKPSSMGGTGLTNSFTAYLPKKMDKIDYYILFAHEHLHNWLGGKIRNNNENAALNYWWSEGFTEYYTRVIALKSGGISVEEFVREVNQLLKDYYLSPVISEQNTRVKQDFWNDEHMQKLPYYRGFVFAIYLNHLITENGADHSLDDVMLDLFKQAKEHDFSADEFKRIVNQYTAKPIDAEFVKFIEQGATIDLADLIEELPIEKITTGTYELGFDKEIFIKQDLIKNINEKSNAYKAGLRNGDIIPEGNIPGGYDPAKMVILKTKDKTWEFKPESYDKREIYQFKMNLTPQDKEKIKEFFDVE